MRPPPWRRRSASRPGSFLDRRSLADPIVTDDGELDFQEYFVHRRQEPVVRGVRFDGDAARPTPAVIDAIATAEVVVIGPSNPIVSIGPTLELPGVREALRSTDAPRVAVSPIVGRALEAPPTGCSRRSATRPARRASLGSTRLRRPLRPRRGRCRVADEVASMGLDPVVLPTVMRSDDDRRVLAEALLNRP